VYAPTLTGNVTGVVTPQEVTSAVSVNFPLAPVALNVVGEAVRLLKVAKVEVGAVHKMDELQTNPLMA
jgi:hypothetical protein